MERSRKAKIASPDLADLRRRLTRLRARVAGESRPQALLLIDEAIEDAGSRGPAAE